MSDDLVARLRRADLEWPHEQLGYKAADRIEELEAALREASGALHGAADVLSSRGADHAAWRVQETYARTRAALDGTPDEQEHVNRLSTIEPDKR